MSLHNADAELSRAVDILNTPHKSLRDLLVCAWTQGLSRVSADDLPEPLRSEFQQIEADLTSKPPSAQGEGPLQATVRQMTDGELDKVARRIRGLAHAAEQESARQESLRPKP